MVRGVYEYVVVIRAGKLKKLRIHSLVQHNRSARPFLVPGRNVWRVGMDRAPRGAVVNVEVAYKLRRRTKSLKERWAEGLNLYDGRFAQEAPDAIVVKREMPGKGAVFEIDVPSDDSDDPAWPRMLHILYKVQ